MRTAVRYFWIIPTLLFAFTFGCSDNSTSPETVEPDFSTVPAAFDTSGITPVQKNEGLHYYVISPGSGPFEVVERDVIQAYYTLRDSTGDVLDSSYKNGQTQPAEFDLLKTIEGFRKGILGLKKDGKRTIVVPPSLGYTNNKLAGKTLYFDVELDSIISK